jgi:hypothetical protein
MLQACYIQEKKQAGYRKEKTHMLFTSPHSTRISAEKEEKRSVPFIPIVYEHAEAQPIAWEYHVLHINALEEALPTAQTLNELGQQGWILVGVLNEHSSGKGEQIHYYFLRQPTK